MSWPSRCGCKPGTYDDGWQEVRCEECIEHEKNIWREMFRRMKGCELQRRYGWSR